MLFLTPNQQCQSTEGSTTLDLKILDPIHLHFVTKTLWHQHILKLQERCQSQSVQQSGTNAEVLVQITHPDSKHTYTHHRFTALWTVRNNPGEPVPEETFTHSQLSWSSVIPYLLPPSIMIHGILPVQFTCLTVFFHNLSPTFLGLAPSTSYSIHFSTNHCLLFAIYALTITTYFAVLPRLCHLILVSLSTVYLELYLVA